MVTLMMRIVFMMINFDDRDDDDDVDLAKCRLPWANLRMRYTTIISIDTDTFASAVILCCLE